MLLAAAALVIAACSSIPAYSHFITVDNGSGWRWADSVRFVVPLKQPGRYALSLHLRTTNVYPYTQLSLLLRSRDKAHTFRHSDTVTFDISDPQASSTRRGTSVHEYTASLPSITLDSAATLIFSVAHNMTHDPLPGVSDVGITIEQL